MVNADQILPTAVQQGIRRSRLLFGCRFPLRLLHLYAARVYRQRHDGTAFGVGQTCFVEFLRLLGEKSTESHGVDRRLRPLEAERIACLRPCQAGVKFLFPR